MLFPRVVTALWFAPLFATTLWAGSWIFGIFLFLLVVLASWEASRLLATAGYPQPPAVVAALPILLIGDVYTGGHWALPIVVLVMLIMLAFHTWRNTTSPVSLAACGLGLMLALYLALPLHHMAMLRESTNGLLWAVWAVGGTWVNDTMAYVVGRLIGRHKMIPRISPGKTWEGTAGGVLATIFVSSLAGPSLLGLPWLLCAGLGLLIGFAGITGDLVESFMKRSAGVKDSGWLLPGHGGVLDRIDSLIFAAPAVFYYKLAMVMVGLIHA
jgi:phosphatidate cytidylyltransferase